MSDGSAYAASVLSDAPLAYYRLNETNGTQATDSSGNNFHGTYTGTYTLGAEGPPVGGTAVQTTEGQFGYADCTLSGVNTGNGTDVTVEWWQLWDGSAANGDCVAWVTGAENYAVWIDAAVSPVLYGFNTWNNDIWGISNADQVFSVNAWHHLVATFRNGARDNSRMWIDAVEKTLAMQRNGQGTTYFCSNNLRINCGAGTYNGWDGKIAHVAVYNGTLAQARIDAHYAFISSLAFVVPHRVI